MFQNPNNQRKMNSENTLTEVNKANQLQQEGKLEEAIAVYRGLTEKLYQQLGKLLSQQKNWDEAIATYHRALELNPEAYESHHQLGEAIYQRVMENPETFFDRYNLAEIPHKDYQLFDPELPFVCFLNDPAFLQATAHLDDPTYTVEWYRVYLRRSLGEAEKQGCINWLQTPGHSRELGLKVWRENLAEFQTLLRLSFTVVGLEEAVNCYHRASELYPNHHSSYYRLAEVFTEQGKHEEALVLYHQLSLKLAEAGEMAEAVACFQQATYKHLREGKIYEIIWKGLNKMAPLDSSLSYYPTEINREETYEYFQKTSNYKIINFYDLTISDKLILQNHDFLLENLQIITQDCINLEEIYANSFQTDSPIHLSNNQERSTRSFRDEWKKAIHLQQNIIQTGYVYAVCPWSGRILRSQESFCYFPWIFYRFVGNEVFYLIVGDWFSSKQCIYVPRLEIIILLYPFPHMDFTWVVNHFKSHLVSSWQKVQAYLSSQTKEVVVVMGISNIGHYLWNELSGVNYFYQKMTFNQVHKFLLDVNYEFFNFEEIFPKIASDRIIRVEDSQKISQKIIDHNLFVVRLVDFFIEEELVNRIYQECIKKSSQFSLKKVEQAQTHFPLLWIGIRNYKRKWLSQTEGIANIIKRIYDDFPDLAVVFDAWSITERDQGEYDEVIAVEQACLEQIMSLLPPGISTYSTIGRPIYETIVWGQAIDLYAVPFGTGMTFVTWIASKPGVAYGNKNYYAAVQDSFSPVYRENAVPPVLISTEYITEDENNPDPTTRNYDCDWQVIYNELMQILQNLPKRV
jgi:tetratricopeptide (TPR) repeat protein